MRITSLVVHNFKSFRGTHQLPIPSIPGLYYLGGRNDIDPLGSNGAGKSTIFEAWAWAWFGRTYRNLRGSHIEPWQTPDVKCWVSITWETDYGTTYTLLRQRNPITLTLQENDGQPEIVEQHRVDEIIGLSKDEFVHVYLLGQSVPLFFDLAPAQKMEMLQDVLDLSVWVDRAKLADTKAKRLEQARGHTQNIVIELSARQEELAQQLKDLLTQSKEFAQRQKERLATIRAKMKEQGDSKLISVKEQRELGKQIGQRLKELQKFAEKIAAMNTDYTRLEKAAGELKVDRRQHTDRVTDLENQIACLAKLGQGECPTCYQDVGVDHIKACTKEWKLAIVKEQGILNELWDKTERIQIAKSVLEEQLTSLEQHHQEVKEQINKDEERMSWLQGVESRCLHILEEYEKNYVEVEQEQDPSQDLRKQKQIRLEQLKLELSELATEQERLIKEYEATAYWTKGFREIRLMLLDESLQLLEIEVNNALVVFGLGNWRVVFDVEKEKVTGGVTKGFHVLITPPGAKESVPWEAYSGGESQRLRLAGRMGVASLITGRKGIQPGIEIYDEPSAGLSQEGIDDLIDLLQNRSDRLGIPIVIVDHRTLDLTGFAGSYLVIKDKNGSWISHE